MRYFWLILLCCLSATVFAQDPRLVQFSGVISNADSNTVVPYVTITNKTQSKTYSANYKGYFSFIVHEGDIMVFSAVGYKSGQIVIPANLPENKYTVRVSLTQDVIDLPAVRVYPWASTDEFKKEFMSMKVADDDLEIAKKNVSKASLVMLANNMSRDGDEMQGINYKNFHQGLSNKGMATKFANPLLNPVAWGALLNQIIQGDKSRKTN